MLHKPASRCSMMLPIMRCPVAALAVLAALGCLQAVAAQQSCDHEIKSGDTFWALSQRFQTEVAVIQRLNPGVNPNNLQIGQKVKVPCVSVPAPTKPAPRNPTYKACWKLSYGRGAGRPLHTCADGMEKYDALCYRPCRDSYSAFHASCFQRCPSGYQDHGALCTRPPHIYGKGCCCTIFTKKCCGNCPSGYRDDGCTCHRTMHTFAKDSYIRGTGVPMGCGSNEEKNGALCYPRCRPGYNGNGPVCWSSGAPAPGWQRCNDIGWGPDREACDEMNSVFTEMGLKMGTLAFCAAAVVAAVASAGALAPAAAAICPQTIAIAADGAAQGVRLAQFPSCPS
ncbi:hypothetical protein COHA_003816 [Chlorella ohadii]|uniref:LysM domain-containing protein n=1 Tax=Chlorella ohadii TaxID=2649997 RepID=A0AAD5DUQ4_9CHLO|nr:hypothetical protein COHA_003816 [Chlorella ohadii]